MYLRRFLFTLFAALIATASFGQSNAKSFTLNAANQCAQVSVAGYPTVGIQVTGTFSATLQPEVSIAGQSPQNTQVTPTTSATAQSTITTTGTYAAAVGGMDTFLLCVSSYVSGSAVVWLNPSAAVNASLLGSGISNTSSFPARFASLDSFGDSTTGGTQIPQPTEVWAQLLASDIGLGEAFTNHGVAGAHINGSGFLPTILAASTSSTYASTTLWGANDLSNFATNNAAGQAQIIAATQTGVVFLALPASQKVLANAMTQSGSWSHDGLYTSYDRYSNTSGNSLTASSIPGPVIYLGLMLYPASLNVPTSSSSVFDVLVDGVSTSGGAGYSLSVVITGALGTYMPYVMRFPGFSAGSHTVQVLVGAGSGRVEVYFIGGSGNNPANLPWTWCAGALPQTGSPSEVPIFNAQLSAACTQLTADGLLVTYLNPGAGMSTANTHPYQFFDGLHPSLYGNYLVAQNFLSTIYPTGLNFEALTALLQAAAFGNWSAVPITGSFNGIAFSNFSATATGGSATLPSQPVGFVTFQTGSSTFKIPYYQ